MNRMRLRERLRLKESTLKKYLSYYAVSSLARKRYVFGDAGSPPQIMIDSICTCGHSIKYHLHSSFSTSCDRCGCPAFTQRSIVSREATQEEINLGMRNRIKAKASGTGTTDRRQGKAPRKVGCK